MTERGKAMKENRNVSPKNCLINCGRVAPMTFRNPTSLARIAYLAVERLM